MKIKRGRGSRALFWCAVILLVGCKITQPVVTPAPTATPQPSCEKLVITKFLIQTASKEEFEFPAEEIYVVERDGAILRPKLEYVPEECQLLNEQATFDWSSDTLGKYWKGPSYGLSYGEVPAEIHILTVKVTNRGLVSATSKLRIFRCPSPC